MTVYATEADFKAAFSTAEFNQLTTEVIDNEQVQDGVGFALALENTSRFIDAEISGRYLVPLALPCGGIVNQICLDVARWYLYDDSIPDAVQKRYDRALNILAMIKSGKLLLTGTAIANPVVNDRAVAIATGLPQVFTDDYLSKLL